MELKYKKFSLFCLSTIFSTASALAATINISTNVTPNTSNPAYITYDPLPFSTIYSGVQWLSYFIITDESTGEKSYLRMEFLTN